MAANGPVIYATSDAVVNCPEAAETALSTLLGVCYSEELPVAVIEGLVWVQNPNAGVTEFTVVLWEGPVTTGQIRQEWRASYDNADLAALTPIAFRYLDSKPPSANVQYSVSLIVSGGSDTSQANIYGFTATVFAGGIVPLGSND